MLSNVAENGNKGRCFRQHFAAENGDFVARNGDFLSPFSATTLAGAVEYLAVT